MTAVTIISPVRNGAATLRDCLQSVAEQSVRAEHIVVDGGSADTTPALLAQHRAHLARVISEPDNGLYDAINKGIGCATGDVVGVLNADDCYADREVLARVLRAFDTPGTDACYGDLDIVAQSDPRQVLRRWRSGRYDASRFYWGWMPPHPTFFVRRRIYEAHGTFRLDMGSAADYELMLRFLLRHGIGCAYIPALLVKMRAGGVSSARLRNRLLAHRMDRRAWQVNGLRPYPWTVAMKPLRKLAQWIA
jgi:glycosyltransferase